MFGFVLKSLPLMFALAGPALGDESCQSEAVEVYSRIRSRMYTGGGGAHSSDFGRLKDLHSRGCFDFTKLDVYNGTSLTSLNFDPKTMEPIGRMADVKSSLAAREKSYANFLGSVGTLAEAREFARTARDRWGASLSPAGQTTSDAEKGSACADNGDGIIKQLPPVRNQGPAGYCTYYATADALSVALKTNVSASYLGNLISPKANLGGQTAQFNDVIAKIGLCSEKTMPSNNLPDVDSSYPKYVATVDEAIERSLRHGGDPDCKSLNELTRLFPGTNLREILALSKKIGSSPARPSGVVQRNYATNTDEPVAPSAITTLALEKCAHDRATLPRNVKVVSEYTRDAELSFRAINKALSAGRPAVIGYEFNRLQNGAGGNHSSTVVRRRYVNGHCQFLVRNSWGKSSCTRVVEEADACRPAGYFWVNALTLSDSVSNVDHVE